MRLSIYFNERHLVRYLGHGVRLWPEAAERVLERIGRAVFDQSQREVRKGRTHILAGSTRLSIAPHTVTITYFAPYARIVHFRKRVHHPEGKRMFLTGPLGKGKRLLGPQIAQAVQDAMDNTPTA